ncbi:cysteine synthase [Sarracenia purpurea var. burkii]
MLSLALLTTLQSIEKELLERLKKGVYGDIYDYPVKEYNKVLDMEGLQAVSEDEEEEPEIEYIEDMKNLKRKMIWKILVYLLSISQTQILIMVKIVLDYLLFVICSYKYA